MLLAIGIGANVAVFGFAEPLIRRPLPVPGGRDLVRLVKIDSEAPQQYSFPVFNDIRTRSRSFLGVAAHQYSSVAVGRGENARSIDGEVVSGNYFDVMRVQPALGRMLQPSDDQAGGQPVVVISDGAWRELFASVPDVVGRTVHLNGHAFEIVGVAPKSFSGSYTAFASRFWAPIAMYKQVRPRNAALEQRGWSWLSLTARMRPDVGIEDAVADLARIDAELAREFPTLSDSSRFALLPASGLPEAMRRTAGSVIAFAATTAALLLLVTCANVAGVLQSRAMARIRETSIRYALGASRFRIIRQWLTESVLLATAGALAGLAAAFWIERGLVGLIGEAAPIDVTTPAGASWRIVMFTAALAIASGLFFGLFPAWRSAARGERALREQAATVAGNRWAIRTTRVLVGVQVTVSVALLVTAGLLTQSLKNAATFDIGFESSGLVGGRLDLGRHGYDRERGAIFVTALLAKLRARGDVVAASLAAVAPLGGDSERNGFRIPGYKLPDGRTIIPIDVNAVSGDYFSTMGIPIVSGRPIADTDDSRAVRVAVVNETMASRYWPGTDAVGQIIVLAGSDARPIQVVGIAKDIKYYSLEESPRPYVYLSAQQAGPPAQLLQVRTNGAGAPIVAAIKRLASEIDPLVVIDRVMTFEELRQQPLVMRRAMMVMANVFGVLALLLTLVGIYGTMSNVVGQRTREIGVRMAFGASVSQVFRLVLRDGLVPVVFGVVVGLLAAGMVTQLIASELFGVRPSDPITHGVAAAMVIAAAIAALSVPAGRAARVDPVSVLRD